MSRPLRGPAAARRLRAAGWRLRTPAAAVRAATAALVAAVALGPALAAPSAATATLGAVGVVLGLAGALWPGSPLPAASLACLAGSFAVAVHGAPGPALVGGTLGEAAGLWVAHSGFALAAALPVGAGVDRRVVTRWAGRVGATLAVTAPVVVLLLAAAAVWPLPGAARAVGVLAALGVVALPVALLRHR